MADLRERLQNGLADRYRIERELGRGGMATVYLAHDLKHDRQVALKVLHPELAASLGPERFQREIRTTARLQHPHILPVLDSGEATSQLWYTMPYVEGESLRDRLQRECQLPLDNALQITQEVADALEYAHGQGVVHRDIKPENILLSRGHALVADFGIARALQVTDAEQLTATGLAIGTPIYMSPEQAGGTSTVDSRSDVYSLGCVLYEMLAGEVPYTGRTPQAVIAKRVLEPLPHVRTLRQSVPEGVEQAITRALAVTPADRFATAAEFARALAQPLTDRRRTNRPAAPQPIEVYGSRDVARRVAPLALGVLLAVGVLLVWLYTRSEPVTAGPKRLAVLPFENLGDSADAYFADGITDAVRDRLSASPGLEVIASTSSGEYRHTRKPPRQIGQELRVPYILTGKVRWAKTPGEPSRVEVRPELIETTSGAERWGELFDAALSDVFRVQADIADKVTAALNVNLSTSRQSPIPSVPTHNLPAYDAYLRGVAAHERSQLRDLAILPQAVAAFEEAVALDSMFLEAWAYLARVRAQVYGLGPPTQALAEATRHAAEKAMALGPTRPQAHRALARFYENVLQDHTRAFAEDSIALAYSRGDADLLALVGADEVEIGRLNASRMHLEQALRLDPHSIFAGINLGYVLVLTREFAQAERVCDHLIEIHPVLVALHWAVVVQLAQGHLARARGIVHQAMNVVDPSVFVAFLANGLDLYWVLDNSQQERLLRLTPGAFNDNRANWALALAETYALRGDRANARTYADSARVAFGKQLQAAPNDGLLHVLLGVSLAYLGRKAEAVREGERAIAMGPFGAFTADCYKPHQLARIYLLVGEPERALDRLDYLLTRPCYLSPGWLKIDPNFDPLRGNPRFERLVDGS